MTTNEQNIRKGPTKKSTGRRLRLLDLPAAVAVLSVLTGRPEPVCVKAGIGQDTREHGDADGVVGGNRENAAQIVNM